jgi:hypothetical protein
VPLLSSKVYSAGDRLLVSGDLHDRLVELYLPASERLDRTSPVFLRETNYAGIFQITYLRSERFGRIQRQKTIAYDPKLAAVSESTIVDAWLGDASASNAIGQLLLWKLDDPNGARPYLERAAEGGIADALIDLAIIALLPL